MATGQVELIGTLIGSTGSNGGSGNDKTKVVDGDLNTFYDAANASGDWVGIDAGVAATVTRVRFAPRRGDATITVESQYEDRVVGAKVQASSTADFSADVTDAFEFPAFPAYHSRRMNEIVLPSPLSKQRWRWFGPLNGRCNLAELRLIANAGPTNAKPVAPKISPSGGRFPSASATVTITSLTTSATIYYTTDGSTPTAASTLYTGPFTLSLPGGVAKTVKAIAIDATLGTPNSDVTTSAPFNPWAFKPNEAWHDTDGHRIEAHGGGIVRGAGGAPLLIGGFYYWVGTSCDRYNNIIIGGGGYDANGATGVWLYKSTDLLNWQLVGNIINVPAGYNYLIRPHILYNAANAEFVCWVMAYRYARDNDRQFVFKASNIESQTWTSVHATGLLVDGVGAWDKNLFQDDDTLGYLIYNPQGGANIVVSKLDANYYNTTGESVTAITGGRESPAMVKDEGKYILFTSQPAYYDSDGSTFLPKFALAASPLGTYTSNDDLLVTNPVGTNYNGQCTFALKLPGGILWWGDYWKQTDIAQSNGVPLPVDDQAPTLASFDLSRFAIPSNALREGLAWAFELDEIDGSNPIDKVLGTTTTLAGAGTPTRSGARLRWRGFASNRYDVANSAQMQVGDIDFFVCLTLYRQPGGAFPTPLAKDDFASNRGFGFYIDRDGNNCIRFYVSPDGSSTTEVAATNFGAFPNATRIRVIGYHLAGANQLGIVVNGDWANRNFISYSGGVFPSTAPLSINTTANPWAGSLARARCYKRTITQADVEADWNGGSELTWSMLQLPAVDVTPAPAGVRCAAVAPTVRLGSLSLSPAAAAARTLVFGPTIGSGGSVQIIPEPVIVRGRAIAPAVRLGSLTLSPAAAIVRARAIAPTIPGGSTVAFTFEALDAFVPGFVAGQGCSL